MVQPTIFGNQFVKVAALACCKSGSQFWHTDDLPGELLAQPAGDRGTTSFYLPLEGSLRRLWRRDNRIQVSTRRGGSGDRFLGHGYTTCPPYGAALGGIQAAAAGLSHGAMQNSDELAFGWSPGLSQDPWDEVFYDFPGPTQTHRVYVSRKACGYIGRWQVTIPALGVSQVHIARRMDYGGGANGIADRIFEQFGTGNEFVSNPTMAGDDSMGPTRPNRLNNCHASPTAVLQVAGNDIISLGVPMEWNYDAVAGLNTHGGSDYVPVIWKNMLLGYRLTINAGGVGVHRMTYVSYYGFDVPQKISGTYTKHSKSNSFWGPDDTCDAAWYFDAQTQTATNMSFDPGTKNNWNWIVDRNNFSTYDAAHVLQSQVASLIPGGFGGPILRSTGTFYGPATDLSIGYYTGLSVPTSPFPGFGLLGLPLPTTWTIQMGHFAPVSPIYDGSGMILALDSIGTDAIAGWHTFDVWIITDSFANVKTAMRNLYLAGVGANVQRVRPNWV